MSRKIESRCVDCGLPCKYNACPYYKVEVVYCDDCGEEAEYELYDKDYCQACAENMLQAEFDCMSTEEKAACLNVDLTKIKTRW